MKTVFGCRDRLISSFLEHQLPLDAKELSKTPVLSREIRPLKWDLIMRRRSGLMGFSLIGVFRS
jgi:hypothetical protein